MRGFLASSALSFALVLGSAGAARADVAPPDSSECNGKTAGAACLDDSMKPGICTDSMCSKLDYSGDAGPHSVSYACTLCIATDGGVSSGTGGGGTGAGPGSSSGGCAMAEAPARDAAWLVAILGLPLLGLGLLARRRSR